MPARPEAGVFGPASPMWRVSRESALPIFGMRAVLLQIAHPVICHAGVANSEFQEDFLARTIRTFTSVYAMMYGDRATALRYAKVVHRVHTKVSGTVSAETSPKHAGRAYRANQPELLFWVLATMIESAFGAHATLLRPLPLWERRMFYEDMKTLGLMLGIPEETMPPDLDDFKAYFDRMLAEELHVGQVARSLVDWLFDEGWQMRNLDRAWAAGIMEPKFADAFGLPSGKRWTLLHHTMTKQLRLMLRRSPRAVRWVPPYHAAMHRIARAEGRLSGATPAVFHGLNERGWVPSVFQLPKAA